MTVPGAEIKHRMAKQARALGCCGFGVTAAGPVADFGRYQAWLQAGRHGDMAYLARDAWCRGDPRRLVPWAQSVICVAVPYGPQPREEPAPRAVRVGRMAALFRGADYHRVVREILEELADLGRALAGGGQWHAEVDTGALLERSLATQAGLGVIGRHCQLIVSGHGSMAALGTLLTDRVLPADEPVEADPCGSCDACVRACPTRALSHGRGMDARRCLSYYTTATRTSIPEALRPRLGNRLYGCDVCQTACPWNRMDPARERLRIPVHPSLRGREGISLYRLHHWLGLGTRALKRELGTTAQSWLPRAALQRTICVLLGNAADPASQGPLERLLAQNEVDPMVREHASWALAQVRHGR